MKKYKTISIILCASMLMSMTGCSGNKKKILTAADEYANAVIAADIDDLSGFMDDDEEFAEAMEIFMDEYTSKEDLEEVFDFILENTTYTVDKKSLEVTDKKASVQITYTMVDYMDVYDDLDDDAEIEDYLEALEDAKDTTIEIDQEVEFELVKDEWKVVDDENESLLEVYEFYPEICDMGWCGIGELSFDTFRTACEDILFEDNLTDYSFDSYSELYTFSNGVFAQILTYSDPDAARGDFDNYYNGFQNAIANGEFDGEFLEYDDGNTAYILFDGYSSDRYFMSGDLYGGVFYSEGVCLVVFCADAGEPTEETVDVFLEAMGCPAH